MLSIKQGIDSLVRFIKESYVELKKVTWLSKKEAVASTLVVVILIIIMSIYIGIIDFILAKIVSLFLGGRV
ncbi:MAG: preprotein translocase subunit SecE [Endomicrobia bacterium]|nr:preprotein translocase subunit SecE [Endomicrobiia bacterium]MCX7940937.1 preprotein translocase subunit SecE [Endomicrobiia bacterium]MDW8055662.1 preprotein translocase subunit SecE [Elusimicrobiota bacterium]